MQMAKKNMKKKTHFICCEHCSSLRTTQLRRAPKPNFAAIRPCVGQLTAIIGSGLRYVSSMMFANKNGFPSVRLILSECHLCHTAEALSTQTTKTGNQKHRIPGAQNCDHIEDPKTAPCRRKCCLAVLNTMP